VIPAEITAKHGVSQEDVFRHGGNAQGIEDAVFNFATVAHDHLNTAYDMLKAEGSQGRVPGDALPVFLAGVRVIRVVTMDGDFADNSTRCQTGSCGQLPPSARKGRLQRVRPETTAQRRAASVADVVGVLQKASMNASW
jgi:hypothetical protein